MQHRRIRRPHRSASSPFPSSVLIARTTVLSQSLRRVKPHPRCMKFDKTLDIQRAMVVYAHPDDAEFGLAGTMAKWAKAGVEITYCMVTNGASGSDDETMTREKLRDTRYAEQREAAKILGVKHCEFLGYEDGYLYPTLEVRLMSRARSASTNRMSS